MTQRKTNGNYHFLKVLRFNFKCYQLFSTPVHPYPDQGELPRSHTRPAISFDLALTRQLELREVSKLGLCMCVCHVHTRTENNHFTFPRPLHWLVNSAITVPKQPRKTHQQRKFKNTPKLLFILDDVYIVEKDACPSHGLLIRVGRGQALGENKWEHCF